MKVISPGRSVVASPTGPCSAAPLPSTSMEGTRTGHQHQHPASKECSQRLPGPQTLLGWTYQFASRMKSWKRSSPILPATPRFSWYTHWLVALNISSQSHLHTLGLCLRHSGHRDVQTLKLQYSASFCFTVDFERHFEHFSPTL